MLVQSPDPRESVDDIFWGEASLVGVVEREEEISEGREDLKAPRQLIVRGTCRDQKSVLTTEEEEKRWKWREKVGKDVHH